MLVSIKGCMVVADAMNCQIETAEAILEAKADYLLSAKANQETLMNDIAEYVQDKKLADDYADFVRSEEGQSILEKGGFTSVHSARGLDLIERFGVKDVQ